MLSEGLKPTEGEPAGSHAVGDCGIGFYQHLVGMAGEPIELPATESALSYWLAAPGQRRSQQLRKRRLHDLMRRFCRVF